MRMSEQAILIVSQLNGENTKLGEIRKLGKEIKKNHDLAIELWSTGEFFPRQLAILIMDKKLLSPELIDSITEDIQSHDSKEQNHLADWFMANQLAKDKKTIALLESWEKSKYPIQRRLFWYYQARLRWTGKILPDNTETLLISIEENLLKEKPEVQWAMNFTAGQIGIFDSQYRSKCIELGEKYGLYKDEPVTKGCTPNYLPEFIRIEVEKHQKS